MTGTGAGSKPLEWSGFQRESASRITFRAVTESEQGRGINLAVDRWRRERTRPASCDADRNHGVASVFGFRNKTMKSRFFSLPGAQSL